MISKSRKEIFIENALIKHGEKIDYSKVNYVNNTTPIKLYCKEHNISYAQTPNTHLRGKGGCPICNSIAKGNAGKLNTYKFIEKAKIVHGDKYDYSLVNYVHSKQFIKIICNKCKSEFEQTPNNHLIGNNCPYCIGRKIKEEKIINRLKDMPTDIAKTNIFISKAKKIHGDTYSYAEAEYRGSEIPVSIICKTHGVFWQTPHGHLKGHGCKACSKIRFSDKMRTTHEKYINKVREVHNNRYDYTNTKYTGIMNKITYRCPEHGMVTQSAKGHLVHSCPECAIKDRTMTTKEFVDKAILVHDNKYDYSKVNYTKYGNPIIIICKKHGEFIQNPHDHLRGSGCLKCISSAAEQIISDILDRNHIKYLKEYYLDTYNFRYDFYLPELNILIEYDGLQHFIPINIWGGEEQYLKRKENDKFKTTLANSLNIPLIRIPHGPNKNILNDLNSKINNIYQYKKDNKYYVDFSSFSTENKLPDNAMSENYKQYEFRLI